VGEGPDPVEVGPFVDVDPGDGGGQHLAAAPRSREPAGERRADHLLPELAVAVHQRDQGGGIPGPRVAPALVAGAHPKRPVRESSRGDDFNQPGVAGVQEPGPQCRLAVGVKGQSPRHAVWRDDQRSLRSRAAGPGGGGSHGYAARARSRSPGRRSSPRSDRQRPRSPARARSR
jgi:hypothetical protein